jgi:4a-hydroxytetrahydrobiopterin dehydratase
MDAAEKLTRTEASQAVEAIGWRYLLDVLWASVAVPSIDAGLAAAAAAVAACGDEADRHLRVDLRPDRVELSLQTRELAAVTGRDTALAHAISAAVPTTPGPPGRPVQTLELAIDALDVAAIRPFWKAVLALEDEVGEADWLVDPTGRLPTLWFQQLDAPRPQRNRIHFDITVPHDEAEDRVRAALAAGGTLLDDSRARAFWVLADPEGNEVCVCSWQDRDQR